LTAINKALQAAKSALSIQYDAASKTLKSAFTSWGSAVKGLEQFDFENLDAQAAVKFAEATQTTALANAQKQMQAQVDS